MPPISGRPGAPRDPLSSKNGKSSAKNSKMMLVKGLQDMKCSSTPKMMTTSNLINQDSLMIDPIALGQRNLDLSNFHNQRNGGGNLNPKNNISSTIDYSACTIPQSSSRRPQSQHIGQYFTKGNNVGGTTIISDSRDRLEMTGSIVSKSANRKRSKSKTKRDRSQRLAVAAPEERMAFFERKYRKSKKRVKQLISDNMTEKTKNQEILSNHYNLIN
jgi:hypothetical protein